ncbi:MAG: hypothetical protein MZU79_03245 [Anaerotruncus sp.]|nr:hypothetical protein [Anaerotruncus sp.]
MCRDEPGCGTARPLDRMRSHPTGDMSDVGSKAAPPMFKPFVGPGVPELPGEPVPGCPEQVGTCRVYAACQAKRTTHSSSIVRASKRVFSLAIIRFMRPILSIGHLRKHLFECLGGLLRKVPQHVDSPCPCA